MIGFSRDVDLNQGRTGRETGRREAKPPEVAQITETVVPGVPWKDRAIA